MFLECTTNNHPVVRRYYGLWLWFPELFNKLDRYYATHNDTKTVCQIADFQTTGGDVDPCSVPLPGNQGGNSIGFFWPQKQPQYRPENWPDMTNEKAICTNN